jgi:hypothetical protein
MTFTHDHIAQELHRERAARLEHDVVTARLAKPVVRRPWGRPVRRLWWHRLRSEGSTV